MGDCASAVSGGIDLETAPESLTLIAGIESIGVGSTVLGAVVNC